MSGALAHNALHSPNVASITQHSLLLRRELSEHCEGAVCLAQNMAQNPFNSSVPWIVPFNLTQTITTHVQCTVNFPVMWHDTKINYGDFRPNEGERAQMRVFPLRG